MMFNLKKNSSDLLSNIKNQMHEEHIDRNGQEFHESDGFERRIEKNGPRVRVETRELAPQEAISQFGDIFDEIQSMFESPSDFLENDQDSLLDEAVGNLDESVDDLSEAVEEDFGEESWDDVCPGCHSADCQCGDLDPMDEENSFMPDKEIMVPTQISGGEDWFRIQADLDLASRMAKTSQYSLDHILTLVEPTKYSLSEKQEDTMSDLYVSLSDDVDMEKVSEKIDKFIKNAYYITDDDYEGGLHQDDRVRENGPTPYNYQKWLKQVGESHVQAMNRLEEHKNPDNELMKLRIPDGEHANPQREILKSTETRMVEKDANHSKHSVLDNIETRLDSLEKKLAGRRETKEDKSIEAQLRIDSDTKLDTNAEGRLSKNRDEKLRLENTESRLEEEDFHKDDFFDRVYEVVLDKHRNNEKVLKTAGFGGAPKGKESDLGLIPHKDEDMSLGEIEEPLDDRDPRLHRTIEQQLSPSTWMREDDTSPLRDEIELENSQPTQNMQEDNGVAIVAPPEGMAAHATGEQIWGEDVAEEHKPKDFPSPNDSRKKLINPRTLLNI